MNRVKQRLKYPKIDKNIPVPLKYGFWQNLIKMMDIGDSFITEAENRDRIITSAGRANSVVVTRRISNEDKIFKIRVWRVK